MGCFSQRGVCCARVRRWVVGSCQRPCRRADLTGGEGPPDSSDARGTPGAPRRRHRGALTSGRKGTGDSQPLLFLFLSLHRTSPTVVATPCRGRGGETASDHVTRAPKGKGAPLDSGDKQGRFASARSLPVVIRTSENGKITRRERPRSR